MTPQVHFLPGSTPLVLDSPHSGIAYPADFGHNVDMAVLRRAEDTHVEKLYDFASGLGAAWIEALFPRSYLDANRATEELDVEMVAGDWPHPVVTEPVAMAKIRIGKALIWRLTNEGKPIYDRLLSVDEVQQRIQRCWVPYHAAVADAIAAAHARHGYSLHVNCHSMPAVASSHTAGKPGQLHADFVIGDRDGTTAHPELSALVCRHLRSLGYSVEYNNPYKGVELVRRYSDPAAHRHSIQIEVNRKLYMDEQTLVMSPGFADLRRDIQSLVTLLLATDPRQFG